MKKAIYLLQCTAGGLEQSNKKMLNNEIVYEKVKKKTKKPKYHDGRGPAKDTFKITEKTKSIYTYTCVFKYVYMYICMCIKRTLHLNCTVD